MSNKNKNANNGTANKEKGTATLTAPTAPVTKTEAPKSEKPAKPVIEILESRYGILTDSTKCIEKMASVKIGNKLTNKMAGTDPAIKEKKQAFIRIKIDGVEKSGTFDEGTKIVFE